MPHHRVAPWIVLVLAAACSGGGGTTPPTTTTPPVTAPGPVQIAVPRGEAPVIDGVVDHAEWAGAAVVGLEHGVNLRVVQDGAKVYLAISGLDVAGAMGFGCVLVADGEYIIVHHASAKLGTAVYQPVAGGAYRPQSKAYTWREPDAMLRDEGWTASTVGPDRAQQELAFTFATLGLPGDPRPLALGYLYMDPDADLDAAGVITWPLGLADAVADRQLLGGFNPDDVRFAPDTWVTLHVAGPR